MEAFSGWSWFTAIKKTSADLHWSRAAPSQGDRVRDRGRLLFTLYQCSSVLSLSGVRLGLPPAGEVLHLLSSLSWNLTAADTIPCRPGQPQLKPWHHFSPPISQMHWCLEDVIEGYLVQIFHNRMCIRIWQTHLQQTPTCVFFLSIVISISQIQLYSGYKNNPMKKHDQPHLQACRLGEVSSRQGHCFWRKECLRSRMSLKEQTTGPQYTSWSKSATNLLCPGSIKVVLRRGRAHVPPKLRWLVQVGVQSSWSCSFTVSRWHWKFIDEALSFVSNYLFMTLSTAFIAQLCYTIGLIVFLEPLL